MFLPYYVLMKIKCRILSIIGVAILASVSVYFISMAWVRSTEDKAVVATDIMFDMGARGFDIYVDNKLVLDRESVKITPENSTSTLEFCVAKYSSKDDTTEIKGNHQFEQTGKYLVTGIVWISPTYCIKDYLLVTVVDTPTENTPAYILPKNCQVYVGERTNIADLLDIKSPNNEIEITGTSGVVVDGEYITCISTEKQSLFVQASYLNIKVFYQLDLVVTERQTMQLSLNYGGQKVQSLTFHHTQDEQMFTYEIIGAKIQTIICQADCDVVRVVSCNSPTIIIKTLKLGECKLKISLESDPNVVFEVKIVVID